jgi:molybdenum cofactor cytidylyltransferase
MEKFAIIILAAGSSSRLGHPKQLLAHSRKNLLQHTILEALKAIQNVVVVLGSNEKRIREEVNHLPVRFVFNKDWEEGISSSIRCGLMYVLKEEPSIEAAIIMVTDQPFVASSLLENMVINYRVSKKPIIACAYKDTIGVPVLFDRLFFPDLLAVRGQSGARKVIEQNMDSAVTIPFPMGYVDIDTEEDYTQFKKMTSSN